MNKIFVVAIFSLISVQSAMASFDHYHCDAYRISNKNSSIQSLAVSNYKVSLDGDDLKIADGSDSLLDQKIIEGTDGKGDYKLKIEIKSSVASISGRDGARDHNIDINNVLISVSRNSKTHVFEGICTEESETSCGGRCDQGDDSDNDDL